MTRDEIMEIAGLIETKRQLEFFVGQLDRQTNPKESFVQSRAPRGESIMLRFDVVRKWMQFEINDIEARLKELGV